MANYDQEIGQLTKQEVSLPSPVGQSGNIVQSDGQKYVFTAEPAGTVTSVALSLPADLTVSGSPITSSGTLSAVWASEAANTVHIAPNGSSGVPTWRLLLGADLPTVPVNKGGTNLTSYTTGDILYASASGTLASLADVATGSVLASGGVGVAPAYTSAPSISGANFTSATIPASALATTGDLQIQIANELFSA